jgi:AcrR family transcriptional regulator
MRTRPSRAVGTKPPQPPNERPGPVGGKRDQNRRARTQTLHEAAQRLFLERGIDSVSIDDITREANVAKGSFYRYFRDKEDLVRAAFEPARTRVLGAFERAERKLADIEGPERVRAVYMRLGRELAAALMSEREITRLYLQESRAPAVHARVPIRELERDIAAAALRLSELACSHGLLRKVHPQVSTLAVIGATERLLHAFFAGDLELAPTVAISGLVSIVLDGMQQR